MKLRDIGELSLLKIVRKEFNRKSKDVVLGVGDDAAVVIPERSKMLLTTDMMIEGIHFDLKWTTPMQAGYKLVSVNVSDIYAMGGRPRFLLIDFAAPGKADLNLFQDFFKGIEEAMKTYGLTLIGGDMSASDRLIMSATVLGYSSSPITRKGAKRGDLIYVTGMLGDAGGGLELLKKINKRVSLSGLNMKFEGLSSRDMLPLLRRLLMPRAVRPDRFMRASAMIDISDGLLIDLRRLCAESRVGACIYEERIPISSELKKAAATLGLDALNLALGGGDDYELLFTAPSGVKVAGICIGEVRSRGFRIVTKNGKSENIKLKGYEHFTV